MKIQSDRAALPQVPSPTTSVQGESAAPTAEIAHSNRTNTPNTTKQPPEVAAFSERGMTLTKEAMQAVNTFMETAPGTETEKLATVKALAEKGIVPNESKLKAVHAALTGVPFGKEAAEWLKESGIPFPENTRATIEKALQLGRTQEAVKMIKSAELPAEVVKQIEAILKQKGIPAETAAALKKVAEANNIPVAKLIERAAATQSEVLNNAAKQKLMEAVQILLKQQPNNTLLMELARKVEKNAPVQDIVKALRTLFISDRAAAMKPLAEAIQLADMALSKMSTALPESCIVIPKTDQIEPGPAQKSAQMIQKEPSFERVLSYIKETMPELKRSLEKAEVLFASGKEMAARGELMKAIEPLIPLPAKQTAPVVPDELFAHVPPAAKDVLVTRITEKMSQSAIDFKQFKRDITRNLQTTELLMAQKASQQAKPVIETAIKTLDQAILKSDFMLYTDMKTEKQLMQASGQLAEARKLLAKGETQQAARITAEVKALIEKVTFKPTDARVMHMITQETADTAPRVLAGAMAGLYETPTARHAFELVRAAGFTYEHEQAVALVSREKVDMPPSVKQALLSQMHQQAADGKPEQMTTTLTGQQLLSKADPGLQSMMMSLPFLLGGQSENVNVFIRSKNGGDQVDWENCSVYFLFDTKKLGPVGITISSADKNLSIKVQNDKPDFQQKMEPLTVVLKDRLADIGYRVGSVQFSEFQAKEQEATTTKQEKTSMAKGFDFTI
ncbi:hypothetical protein [Domibacillus aminovorans]|uniref:Flagellar hook-length control protein-like C-terminal domain-containing protein n=1 Tax=Domibacillus aminovorans TaxID=29332 RepID=A0A177L086_9BACI|nr:hypothetical protein [Domibacillus aminovorans]OAH59070.1 hypothetical protein AWH49_05260 [Domibacillus aminovorans]